MTSNPIKVTFFLDTFKYGVSGETMRIEEVFAEKIGVIFTNMHSNTAHPERNIFKLKYKTSKPLLVTIKADRACRLKWKLDENSNISKRKDIILAKISKKKSKKKRGRNNSNIEYVEYIESVELQADKEKEISICVVGLKDGKDKIRIERKTYKFYLEEAEENSRDKKCRMCWESKNQIFDNIHFGYFSWDNNQKPSLLGTMTGAELDSFFLKLLRKKMRDLQEAKASATPYVLGNKRNHTFLTKVCALSEKSITDNPSLKLRLQDTVKELKSLVYRNKKQKTAATNNNNNNNSSSSSNNNNNGFSGGFQPRLGGGGKSKRQSTSTDCALPTFDINQNWLNSKLGKHGFIWLCSGIVDNYNEDATFGLIVEALILKQMTKAEVATGSYAEFLSYMDNMPDQTEIDWVHFIGHGVQEDFDGWLVFVEKDGTETVIGAQKSLCESLAKRNVKEVLFNACTTSEMVAAFTTGSRGQAVSWGWGTPCDSIAACIGGIWYFYHRLTGKDAADAYSCSRDHIKSVFKIHDPSAHKSDDDIAGIPLMLHSGWESLIPNYEKIQVMDTNIHQKQFVEVRDVFCCKKPRTKIAMVGRPGVGKSGICSRLCEEKLMYGTYADGVIYIRVGQFPSLANLLSVFYKNLERIFSSHKNKVRESFDMFNMKMNNQNKSGKEYVDQIKKLISHEIQCQYLEALIIFDDVWRDPEEKSNMNAKVEEVLKFISDHYGSRNSNIFISSRFEDIFHNGAVERVVNIDLLSENEALEFLKNNSASPNTSWDIVTARNLILNPNRRLLLFLRLIASRIRCDPKMSLKLVNDFLNKGDADTEKQEFESNLYENTKEFTYGVSGYTCLHTSVNWLQNKKLINQYLLLGIYPSDIAISCESLLYLWQLESKQAIVNDCKMLEKFSLLQYTNKAITMHHLQNWYVVRRLEKDFLSLVQNPICLCISLLKNAAYYVEIGGRQHQVKFRRLLLRYNEIKNRFKINNASNTGVYNLDSVINDEIGEEKTTLLHFAVFFCKPDIVKILINGIQLTSNTLNQKNKLGYTPLHIACQRDTNNLSAEIVKLLLDNGAALNELDIYKKSAAIRAVMYSNSSTLSQLLMAGVSLDIKDVYQANILHYACMEEKRFDCLKILMKKVTKAENRQHLMLAKMNIGYTPAMISALKNNFDALHLFLNCDQATFIINEKHSSGRTLVAFAETRARISALSIETKGGAETWLQSKFCVLTQLKDTERKFHGKLASMSKKLEDFCKLQYQNSNNAQLSHSGSSGDGVKFPTFDDLNKFIEERVSQLEPDVETNGWRESFDNLAGEMCKLLIVFYGGKEDIWNKQGNDTDHLPVLSLDLMSTEGENLPSSDSNHDDSE